MIMLIVRVGRVVAVACQAVMLLSDVGCDRAETAGWTWLSLLHERR